MKPRDRALIASLVVVLSLDWGSKQLVASTIVAGQRGPTIVANWLTLVHARNPGAAFGMFADGAGAWGFLVAFAVISAGALVALSRIIPAGSYAGGLATGLAIGGILGNGLERLVRGEVIDMIAFTAHSGPLRTLLIRAIDTPHWPAFNVADIALTLCVPAFGVMLLDLDDAGAAPQHVNTR